jgi:hypothetical protein
VGPTCQVRFPPPAAPSFPMAAAPLAAPPPRPPAPLPLPTKRGIQCAAAHSCRLHLLLAPKPPHPELPTSH